MESDSLCGHKERRAGKTMVHMTVFLVQFRTDWSHSWNCQSGG